MRYEADISRKHRPPAPEVMAERRRAIQERGRQQKEA
jgi:hypothetical protein